MEGIKMIKRPRLRKPYLIVAWPGMGDVAFKAASFLVEKLKAEQFASIDPAEFFYLGASSIKDGVLGLPNLPESNFYYWKNKTGANDLIIFLSNAQPDLARADIYSKMIINLAKSFHVQAIVGFASMPQAIEHSQTPGIWIAATSIKIIGSFKKYNFHILKEGQISGMNGLFLGLAKKSGVEGFCLLGEIPLYTIQIENPRASAAVLAALAKILEFQLDLTALNEQAQFMENEINKLLDFLKLGSLGAAGPIGEDEVELIKKSLSQLTKLPVSVKEKIERLFEESKINISQASILKIELDKWNVYKEYEDKFLDLFKKNQDKGN